MSLPSVEHPPIESATVSSSTSSGQSQPGSSSGDGGDDLGDIDDEGVCAGVLGTQGDGDDGIN